MKKDNKREFSIKEKSIAIGVVGGTLVGVLTDNIGLWLRIRDSLWSWNLIYTENEKKVN